MLYTFLKMKIKVPLNTFWRPEINVKYLKINNVEWLLYSYYGYLKLKTQTKYEVIHYKTPTFIRYLLDKAA